MKYKWSTGFRGIKGVPAEKAVQELERIAQGNDGRLTAERIVEEARAATCPLHPAFEWDDGAAADQYRLIQAGSLIRNVVVILDEAPNRKPTRAFVSVTQDDDFGPSYVGIVRALSDDQMREQVLSRALSEAKAWSKRYRDYNELAEIVKAVEKTERKLPRRRVRKAATARPKVTSA